MISLGAGLFLLVRRLHCYDSHRRTIENSFQAEEMPLLSREVLTNSLRTELLV